MNKFLDVFKSSFAESVFSYALVFVLVQIIFLILPGFRKRKIQPESAIHQKIFYQVIMATSFMLISSFLFGLLVFLTYTGVTRLYSKGEASGWYYYSSIVIYLVCYDIFLYGLHRLLHWGPLYRFCHYVHHKVTAPSVLTPYCIHPFEAILLSTFHFIIIFIIPLHIGAFVTSILMIQICNFFIHFGFKIYPRRMKSVLRWINYSEFHDLHHSDPHLNGNYGYFTVFWDQLFLTFKTAKADSNSGFGIGPTS